jgi:tetratricopeptide (TPR) repeat protein
MNMLRSLRHIPAKFPLLIFLISAGVGVWAAYDAANAWAKFGLMALAALLYIVLACWPAQRMGAVAGLISGVGVVIALYFLLTSDWTQTPADLGILNRLGLAWMKLRPTLPGPTLHPNIAGGLIAAFIPLTLWVAWAARQKSRRLLALALVGIGLSGVGLLMTSSRAAWLSLAIGLGLWGWWNISQAINVRLRELIFVLPVVLVLIAATAFAWLRFGYLLNLANALPGAASAGSRAEIAWNALHLSRDFPFTGGGLAAFPGLYARYMRVIAVYEYGYAHNLYLDILVEQGIFGLAAFLWITLGSLAWIWAAMRRGVAFAPAVFAGMTVLLVHGFFDDAFYGMGGTPLLWVLPGLAAAYEVHQQAASQQAFQGKALALPGAFVAFPLLLIAIFPGVRASLDANLGAVQMAKIQLAGWPNNEWYNPNFVTAVQPAKARFEQALHLNPANVTALYRLGMVAIEERDFSTAENLLNQAYAHAPGHHGIRKNLGYANLWLGNISEADILLKGMPEIPQEMNYYAWWWTTQERADLSAYATQLIDWQKQHPTDGQ